MKKELCVKPVICKDYTEMDGQQNIKNIWTTRLLFIMYKLRYIRWDSKTQLAQTHIHSAISHTGHYTSIMIWKQSMDLNCKSISQIQDTWNL